MRKLLEARYASARADAEAAQKAYTDAREEESKEILDKLLQKSIEERFDALETHRKELLPSDKRKLVRSVRERQPRKIVVSPRPASQYERWRSKLPYKVLQLSTGIALLIVAVGLALVANSNTPMQMVKLNITGPRVVTEHWPDGQKSDLDVKPTDEFALMRIEGDEGVLRNWKFGIGYTEIRLKTRALKDP